MMQRKAMQSMHCNGVARSTWNRRHARGDFELTSMHSAAEHNAVAAMAWLKAQGGGGDIKIRNLFDKTPIIYAASEDAVDAMKWQEAQCADINARISVNDTPMRHAALGNAVEVLNRLMARYHYPHWISRSPHFNLCTQPTCPSTEYGEPNSRKQCERKVGTSRRS